MNGRLASNSACADNILGVNRKGFGSRLEQRGWTVQIERLRSQGLLPQPPWLAHGVDAFRRKWESVHWTAQWLHCEWEVIENQRGDVPGSN